MRWLIKALTFDFLRGHKHSVRLFCFGEIAFQKCTVCGAESMPWVVSKAHAKDWKHNNPNAIDEYIEINKKTNFKDTWDPHREDR